MSESIEVTIDKASWTEVVSISTGFITNETDNIVKYKEAINQPSSDDTSGHTLQRRDKVRYDLAIPFKVWARTIYPNLGVDSDAILTVTPD